MAVHDDLGNRMKEYYENIPKTKLMRRCPVILRIDGKAFHTFTRGLQKPFDEVFNQNNAGNHEILMREYSRLCAWLYTV